MHTGHAPGGSGPTRATPPRDRRWPADDRARLRWLRQLVRRPFNLCWRAGLPRLAWVERRRASPPDPTLQQLQADLTAELLALGDDALALPELVHVGERLDEAGWTGIAALPARVLVRAVVQAEMLAASAASPALTELARRLRTLRPGQDDRPAPTGEQTTAPDVNGPGAVEVMELRDDDYAQAERLWADSQRGALPAPAPPAAPGRGDDLRA